MAIKIYDDIVLFGRKSFEWDRENREYTENIDHLDFYVSDANNASTLKTGKHWATTTRWVNKESITIEPIEIHTENKGFKLTLDSSADGSSQGGKLSFWMCRIDKDDIHGRIGINQEELNQLFKESTFINGVCQQEVCFYRISGQVGACVVGGERYKEFYDIKDKDSQLSKAKKTTKWELGRVYESKTMRSVWVGDIVDYFTKEKYHWIVNVSDKNEFNFYSIYDDNIRNINSSFPSRIATDIVLDVSNISQILAEKTKAELIHNIKSVIKNDSYYFSVSWYDIYHLGRYYINESDLQKELIKDYCYIAYKYLSNSNRGSYSYYIKQDMQKITEILNYFHANINFDEIDFDSIINKYKE